MVARLLFVGDIHLGRRPSRLPGDLDDLGLNASELTPAAAWRSSVALAERSRVDAVVLAGDVVESVDDRFEAYGHLVAGVERLAKSGIPVFGVAGNHDVQALPRLAAQIPGFYLLGAGGEWELASIAASGGDRVHLLGWSFPAARVEQSPLESLELTPESGEATLGVLHCDVDAGSSPYAPVSSRALEAVPVDGWLLGHIHRPGALQGDRPQGYLGSLVGLDPGEPGRRGPWLVEVAGPGRVSATQIPLAPLRWERVALELEALEVADHEDAADRAFAALRGALERVRERIAADVEEGGGALRLVGCRIELSGRGRHHPGVRALLATPDRFPGETYDGVHYFIEKIIEDGRPDLDLEALSAGDDPPALLARRLLELQADGPECASLLRQAARSLEQETSGSRWSRLGEPVAPGAELRELMLRAGTRQLEALLAQRSALTPPQESEGPLSASTGRGPGTDQGRA